MSVLPPGTALGELEYIEVFEYFDGPRLFSCRNQSNDCFLAVFANEGQADAWLYVRISAARLESARQGRIDLHTAFAAPEDGFSYLVELGESSAKVTTAVPASVPRGYLPEKGMMIRLPLPEPDSTRLVQTRR